jgi:hypothetical protein
MNDFLNYKNWTFDSINLYEVSKWNQYPDGLEGIAEQLEDYLNEYEEKCIKSK